MGRKINLKRWRLTALVGLLTLLVVILALVLALPATKPASQSRHATTYSKDHLPAGRLLFRQKGRGPIQTGRFTAPPGWHLYWNFLCYSETSPTQLVITPLIDGKPSRLAPVHASGISGFGDQPYGAAGSYSLAIQSDPGCDWQVTAKLPS